MTGRGLEIAFRFSSLALIALAAAICLAQDEKTIFPAARFADGDTLTVSSSSRISLALGRSGDKSPASQIVFARAIEYVSRVIAAESGKPSKAEVEFKSSTMTRECQNLGPASARNLYEHGKTFQVVNSAGKTSVEFTPPGAQAAVDVPEPAQRRILAAFSQEARAILPGDAVAKGAEWEAQGAAVAALAAAAGIDGATGGKARFRFAGLETADARMARIEIVSIGIEAGGAGSTLELQGSGSVLVDADRGLVIGIECSGKAEMEDGSGMTGKGDFTLSMKAGFLK